LAIRSAAAMRLRIGVGHDRLIGMIISERKVAVKLL